MKTVEMKEFTMFRLPKSLELSMSYAEAKAIIGPDLLGGMKRIDQLWQDHNNGKLYGFDDEFFENFVHEVNAFNVVYTTMRPLFF
jgi:hypothetical protein